MEAMEQEGWGSTNTRRRVLRIGEMKQVVSKTRKNEPVSTARGIGCE